jgi:hypothetical protein
MLSLSILQTRLGLSLLIAQRMCETKQLQRGKNMQLFMYKKLYLFLHLVTISFKIQVPFIIKYLHKRERLSLQNWHKNTLQNVLLLEN